MKYITTINDVTFEIEIERDGGLLVNGERWEVDFLPFEESSLYSVIMDNHSYEVLVDEDGNNYEVLMQGKLYNVQVLDERAQLLASKRGAPIVETGEISIKSPMPGLIVAVLVSEGQEVRGGQTLIVLESMKMQNELKAPRDGIVQRISVRAGQSVEINKPLITLT